ncbi:MAG: glycosyltransferase family 2 protein [Barnesiella sp.]
MHPLFSIITITFNAGLTLRPTLESVSKQTFNDFEYIIVDGASTDNTLNIVSDYRHIITHTISEKDKGLYDAMNKGLRNASGEYLIFLNAGDSFYNEDTLKIIAEYININNNPDILYGETALVNSKRNFISMRRLKAPEKLSWKSFRKGMLVCHQAFIARRTIAPEYDLTYRFSSDFDWCIRCMRQAKIITNTHTILINYLNEGVTTKNRKLSLKERYRIMVKYYGSIPVVLWHLWFAARFFTARLTGKE